MDESDDWDEAGFDDEILSDLDEAGQVPEDWDDEDDEGGEHEEEEWVELLDSAGSPYTLVPSDLADLIEEEGGRVRRGRRRRRRRRGRRGFRGGKRARKLNKLAKNVRRNKQSLRKIAKRISKILRAIKALKKTAASVKGLSAMVASPGDRKGMRPALGGSITLAAPLAAGMAIWTGLAITPSAPVGASFLVIELYEDTYGAPVVGNNTIPALGAFDVTDFKVAGSNLIYSNIPFVPGGMFGVTGRFYGYPLAAGREIAIGSGSTVTLAGRWSPRADAGANGAQVTAAFISPGLVNAGLSAK